MASFARRVFCYQEFNYIPHVLPDAQGDSPPRDAIIAAFKGRKLTYEIMIKLEAENKPVLYETENDGDLKNPKNSGMISDQFNWRDMLKKFRVLDQLWYYIINERFKNHIYLFTGHGEGGAYAVFAALSLLEMNPDRYVEVTTFGGPRIGDSRFAEYVDSKLKVNRVTHADDYVPLFFHQEHTHHQQEIWISGTEDCDCLNNDNNNNFGDTDESLNTFLCISPSGTEHSVCFHFS
ncbi:hypothetical protein G9A89_005118 [Geosiphon pyriformis]|nr:hypothetical protein G9A89_005118 [Geosiphon pyriformis]